MNVSTIMFLVGLMVSLYLMYRVGRYSPRMWRAPIGRAFLATKLVLLLLFAYALVSVLTPDWSLRDEFRWCLIGFADLSLVYVVVSVVRLQREEARESRRVES